MAPRHVLYRTCGTFARQVEGYDWLQISARLGLEMRDDAARILIRSMMNASITILDDGARGISAKYFQRLMIPLKADCRDSILRPDASLLAAARRAETRRFSRHYH